MATENVTEPVARRPFYLPYDEVNRAGDLCVQARALADCIGAAANSHESLPDNAITNAAWLLSDLVERIQEITALRQEPAEGAQA